jgi:hypothetical protein
VDFEQDALVASDDKLRSVNELALLQLERESAVAEKEEELKTAKEALRKIQEVELPAAMKAAGIEEIKLSNGAKVKLKEDVSISVGSKLGFVLGWLRTHGHGDIIKREMTTSLPKGLKVKEVQEIIKSLKAFKLAPEVAETVHSSTLKALLKEQKEKGKAINYEDFGAFEYKKAEIKLPKD